MQKGDKFILNGILFKGGEDILLEESMPTLKTLYNELIKNPNLIIQIQGHIYDASIQISYSVLGPFNIGFPFAFFNQVYHQFAHHKFLK
ncbi:hypothetical protein N9Y89_01465 [bacterium]|nr:hypothetical protein [bacterium]